MAGLVFWRLWSVTEANYDGNQAFHGFYQMEKNTADVIFYGSSHVYAGINTAALWEQYGIAGYDLAGTMQTLWNTYYNMEESLKYQTPQLMVVDLYGALQEEEYASSTNVIKNASSMKFSTTKIKNLWASVTPDEYLSYLLSYPLTHDSCKTLRRGNYQRETNQIGGRWYKGFKPSYAATRYEQLPQPAQQTERRSPSQKNVEYLEKMVRLAEQKGIRLAFIVVPYEGVETQDEAIYLWIKDFAAENDVLFLDGNAHYEEMGFDAGTDFAEASHLNYSGAGKFTDYLGKWMKESSELTDRRGQEDYASWQSYSEAWAAYQQDQELTGIREAETYLCTLKANRNYILFLSLDNNYDKNLYAAAVEELTGTFLYPTEGAATLVVEDGSILYQTPNEPEYLWHMETETMDIAVVREYGGNMEVIVDSVQQNGNFNDVSILVYDKLLDRIADAVTFNYDGVLSRQTAF